MDAVMNSIGWIGEKGMMVMGFVLMPPVFMTGLAIAFTVGS